jgi:predicted transposase/invertase (TIGR01784 family)
MNQHQDYDKIIKENIEKISESILHKICGITLESMENISATMPKTIERRADFLKIGINKATQKREIFHIEFQTNVHPQMEKRELLYYALLNDKYELPIHQFVIYLGENNWTTPTQIQHPNLTFSYEVICLNKLDYQIFMQSDKPEEIILAILADFKKENKEIVIRSIIQKLKDKSKNIQKLQKIIFQLEILSNLRNLQSEIVKQINAMPITFDIKKDLRYQQGEEDGIEKGIDLGIEKGIDLGIEKGIEKGIDLGIEKGRERIINAVIRNAHINGTSIESIAKILDLPINEIKKRMKQMGLE